MSGKVEEKNINERAILAFFWKACLRHKRSLSISLLVPVGALGLNTLLPFYTGKLLAALSIDIHHAAQYLPFLFASGILGAFASRAGIAHLFENQARVLSDL